MPNTRRALTLPEREQRRAEQRELVRASIDQLRTSDGWQAYLKARRRFPSYSWRNVLLILSQRPTATRVAGFRAWLELGYCVTKGSKGIRIWARCAPSRKRMQAWRNAGADPDEMPWATYKLVTVFDRLSRVRSGGCRRRPSREIRCLPVSRPGCSSAPASRRRGRLWPARSSRSRRPRATVQRRSRARLAGTPGNRSALTRCRECRHPVPVPAISGTDGKSPKAVALHHMLHCGRRGAHARFRGECIPDCFRERAVRDQLSGTVWRVLRAVDSRSAPSRR
jgi:N-terminal domain of anti-restriction factor ArdC